jgi:hypothetical protein
MPAAAVGADGSFAFGSLRPGRYLFRIDGLPNGWMIDSVTLGGREIADVAVEIGAREPLTSTAEGLRITITSSTAMVSGDVIDPHGAPAQASTVIVFAADAARWSVGSRFVGFTRADAEGRFRVEGLPGGAYFIAAREQLREDQVTERGYQLTVPAFLSALVPGATKIELREGTMQTVSIKVEYP